MLGNPALFEELKGDFRRETARISRQDLCCAWRNIFRILEACVGVVGRHFEIS